MTESPNPATPEAELPASTPVPMTRNRRDGWTPERQRGFIAALADSGVVASAARAVGMGATSAYNLRRRPGAKSFAAVWDQVQEEAHDRAFAYVIDQAMRGAVWPRFYRGRFVGLAHRFDTRAAMAALRAADARVAGFGNGCGQSARK